jgi:hypothetical protein
MTARCAMVRLWLTCQGSCRGAWKELQYADEEIVNETAGGYRYNTSVQAETESHLQRVYGIDHFGGVRVGPRQASQ